MRFFKFGLFIALGAMMSSCVFTEEPGIEFPAEMCIEASGITASTATSYTSWLEVRHLNRKHVFRNRPRVYHRNRQLAVDRHQKRKIGTVFHRNGENAVGLPN